MHNSKKSSNFAPAFAKTPFSGSPTQTSKAFAVGRAEAPRTLMTACPSVRVRGCRTRGGEWRSPVAQRSGGPEVACSNHVSPTKWNPMGFHFCVDGIRPRACSYLAPLERLLRSFAIFESRLPDKRMSKRTSFLFL